MPRVSVVVPAYNSVAFIDATMRSILAQTFSDFELVVSDHSSTDGTWEALQHYTRRPTGALEPAGSGRRGAGELERRHRPCHRRVRQTGLRR